ncbi:MAG: inositol-3-phosphate synthase [Candidatus Bathyarchaeota archaeon]|nr:inositol-3-phosphate synthase [Candidatus Bathyarchaeota archaeon]
MGKIRVGIIGVGNCFAGLVQGIEYYRLNPDKKIIGIMHEKIGDYSIFDIEFTSAFDVSENKIGKSLDEAIYQSPNCVDWIQKIPKNNAIVIEAPVLDGVGVYVEKTIKPVKQTKSDEELKKNIVKEIINTRTEMLVNYLPVGSENAVRYWAEIALEANVGIINCMPVFIASGKKWAEEYEKKHLPVIGDDVKGQVGATILNRVLAKLCDDRGTAIDEMYQINIGGNTDFANMLERSRLVSKKISKTEAVQSQFRDRLNDDKIYVGPSDFLPFLGNTKICYINMKGKMFADTPFEIECKLTVDDKANSAGIVIDAVRCVKLALDRKIGGVLTSPSAYLMKHPPIQYDDTKAKEFMEKFIAGEIER